MERSVIPLLLINKLRLGDVVLGPPMPLTCARGSESTHLVSYKRCLLVPKLPLPPVTMSLDVLVYFSLLVTF